MPLFSSDRERRLWVWVLIVLAAIYSTLGLAQSFAETLYESGVLAAGFFIAGCLLVLIAAITQGLRVRPSGIEVFVALGIAAVYLLVLVRMTIPAERTHLIEYGVLALLIYAALSERLKQGKFVPVPAMLAVMLAGLLGVLDEAIQYLLPARVFDPVDMLFNFVAAALAVCSSAILALVRRRSSKDQ